MVGGNRQVKIKDILGKGVYGKSQHQPLSGINISRTGSALARGVKRRGIKPGTDAWFQAWFSRPYLTGERRFR